jgi:hypothetical protein
MYIFLLPSHIVLLLCQLVIDLGYSIYFFITVIYTYIFIWSLIFLFLKVISVKCVFHYGPCYFLVPVFLFSFFSLQYLIYALNLVLYMIESQTEIMGLK